MGFVIAVFSRDQGLVTVDLYASIVLEVRRRSSCRTIIFSRSPMMRRTTRCCPRVAVQAPCVDPGCIVDTPLFREEVPGFQQYLPIGVLDDGLWTLLRDRLGGGGYLILG